MASWTLKSIHLVAFTIFMSLGTSFVPVAANASTITYEFHQTFDSLPGLSFFGEYTVNSNIGLPTAESDIQPYSLNGLIDLELGTNGFQQGVLLSDLQPSCEDEFLSDRVSLLVDRSIIIHFYQCK